MRRSRVDPQGYPQQRWITPTYLCSPLWFTFQCHKPAAGNVDMVSRAAVINAPYSSKKERQNGVGAKHPMGVRGIATRRRSFCAARREELSRTSRSVQRSRRFKRGAGWRRPKGRTRQGACRTFTEGSYALSCTVVQFATDVTAKKQLNFNNLVAEYLAMNQGRRSFAHLGRPMATKPITSPAQLILPKGKCGKRAESVGARFGSDRPPLCRGRSPWRTRCHRLAFGMPFRHGVLG